AVAARRERSERKLLPRPRPQLPIDRAELSERRSTRRRAPVAAREWLGQPWVQRLYRTECFADSRVEKGILEQRRPLARRGTATQSMPSHSAGGSSRFPIRAPGRLMLLLQRVQWERRECRLAWQTKRVAQRLPAQSRRRRRRLAATGRFRYGSALGYRQ